MLEDDEGVEGERPGRDQADIMVSRLENTVSAMQPH